MLVLSATCPPKVLEDVLSILRLGGIVPGNGEYAWLRLSGYLSCLTQEH